MNSSLVLFILALCQHSFAWPTVRVCILARNQVSTLPYMFGQLEEQDYSKNAIILDISTDHNEDETAEWIHEYVIEAKKMYRHVHVQHDVTSDGTAMTGETHAFDWPPSRYRHVARLRQACLQRARYHDNDYALMLDGDMFLTNSMTLRRLVETNVTIVAPLLHDRESNYTNFWAATTTDGYYARSFEYMPIVRGVLKGVHKVPMVFGCVLVRLGDDVKSDGLAYDERELDGYDGPIDDLLTFAWSAKRADVPMYILNSEFFGYLLSPLTDVPDVSLEHLPAQMHTLLMGLVANNIVPPLLHTPLISLRTPRSTLHGTQHVYVVNLDRRTERWTQMEYSMALAGAKGVRWPAVDGRLLSAEARFALGVQSMPDYADPYKGRGLTHGEVGCFLSHYNAWVDMLDNHFSSVIILEDDVYFEPFFATVLAELNDDLTREGTEWDLIYLGRKKEGRADEYMIDGHRHLSTVAYSYWTLGYMLSASGARKLIDAQPLGRMVALDEYLPIMYGEQPNKEWSAHFETAGTLRAFAVYPHVVHPTLYTNQQNYITDTEASGVVMEEIPLGIRPIENKETDLGDKIKMPMPTPPIGRVSGEL